MRSVTRATCNVPCWWEGAQKKKRDTKGEVTNNMTHCILPCLFNQKFSVQTRERASQVRSRQTHVGSLSGFLAGVRFAAAAGAVSAVPAEGPACEVRADVSSVVVWPPCKIRPTKAHLLPLCRLSHCLSFAIILPCHARGTRSSRLLIHGLVRPSSSTPRPPTCQMVNAHLNAP